MGEGREEFLKRYQSILARRILQLEREKGEVCQYVIYDYPLDFPEFFVVRKWLIGSNTSAPSNLVGGGLTLAKARRFVPPDSVKLPVFGDDDPVIAEVWM
jgi:hypothetical protein